MKPNSVGLYTILPQVCTHLTITLIYEHLIPDVVPLSCYNSLHLSEKAFHLIWSIVMRICVYSATSALVRCNTYVRREVAVDISVHP